MGQQQLLLIVLGVIIVGVAIVAGIYAFNAGSEEAAKDEIVTQCMAIAANAQQFYKKPVAMGGGGGDFTKYVIPKAMSATSSAGAFDSDGNITTAGYVVSGGSTTGITITGTPNTGLNYNWTVATTVTPIKMSTQVK